ncbi:hypothetical protein B0J11DRAFT_522438 [Dendryphion nanum]|uniref:Uncharacterized protein n=1 Tax=Dendryphion nanum TaxID=256645 RepID=A0A9P9E3U3_9PLEO|nr:hypothetical protein B0J11DRAFT_522438 [Dendryphion nanum]
MGCIDRKDILMDLLPTLSSSETERAIEILQKYALITKRPASSAVEIHRLVHLAIRNHLLQYSLLDEWKQKAVTRLVEVFPSNSHENRSKWRRLLPHTKTLLEDKATGEDNESTLTLTIKYANALRANGRYNEIEKLEMQVIEMSKIKLGAAPDFWIVTRKKCFRARRTSCHACRVAAVENECDVITCALSNL